MEQYISRAGEHANSEGLAQAVADYWNSLKDSESPALAVPFMECTQTFEPTQEGEYWSSAHMEYQLQYLAIPLFDARGPRHQAMFLFDNAANHTAFAPEAI